MGRYIFLASEITQMWIVDCKKRDPVEYYLHVRFGGRNASERFECVVSREARRVVIQSAWEETL